MTQDELKKLALAYHHDNQPGKVAVVPTKPCETGEELALAYTPGVAQPCLAIKENKENVWEYTSRGNLVAVVSDGTAVLGLGNIGPEAGLPVMEGKAVLFKRFADIAHSVGAILMTDIAHYAGLVAAGVYPSPFGYADVVTTTTHKSLRGPRGGIIFCRPDLEKKINSAVFPGTQGGPLMHVIAGKAVALGEALKPEFKEYGKQVIKNAEVLAKTLMERGLRIVSGGTQSHVMLVDLRPMNLTGKAAEALLGAAHITVNKNAIHNDPQTPFVTSGIRLGTPAMTTRGFKEEETRKVANLIADLLSAPEDAQVLERVRTEVDQLTAMFPVYRP